jgi:hypothetical protein
LTPEFAALRMLELHWFCIASALTCAASALLDGAMPAIFAVTALELHGKSGRYPVKSETWKTNP